jgi:single-strand DNA-binding protein
VNHCVLEVEVKEIPEVRYTQDNQTPVAEMSVQIDGLRPGDPPSQLKVVGWGNLAQDLHNRVQLGQRLVLEGRLRMNTVARKDGLKEKRAEFTLSRLHPVGAGTDQAAETQSGMPAPSPSIARAVPGGSPTRPTPPMAPGPATSPPPVWNTSPLNPEDAIEGDDDIPF